MIRTSLAAAAATVLGLGCSEGTTPGPNQPAVPQPGGAVVSVRDFGARGDGQTLDTAAVQQALEAVPAGGTLRFPSGTYRIQADKGLVPKDNSRIELGDAVLVGENAAGAINQIFLVRGKKGVVISGGTLVGSKAGRPRLGLGIYVDYSEDILIEDVTLKGFYTDGIILTGNTPCQRVQIRRCNSSNNVRTGLAIIHASDVTVEDSTFDGQTGADAVGGLNVEPNASESVANVVVRRCTARKNALVGLYFKGPTSNLTVENNVLEGNGSSGITVIGVDGAAITNNRVTGSHTKNRFAIAVGENVKRATVTGNTLEDNVRGILSASAQTEIRGNTITGTGPTSSLGADAGGDGITCQGVKGVLQDACTVANNTVRQVATGIAGVMVSNMQVLDNTLEDIGQRAISLRSGLNGVIKGNTITRSGLQEAGRYDAIWLEAASNNNLITGNTIHQGGLRSPVGVGPGCTGNQVLDNVVLPY
jgi:nitrous oxidase accessory protein NosD